MGFFYLLNSAFSKFFSVSAEMAEAGLSAALDITKIQFDANVSQMNSTRHSHRMFSKYTATILVGDWHI